MLHLPFLKTTFLARASCLVVAVCFCLSGASLHGLGPAQSSNSNSPDAVLSGRVTSQAEGEMEGVLVALSWTTDLLGAGVDRMGPGVGSLDLKAPGETLVQLELKPVIIGIGSTAALRPQTQWEPCVIPISPDKGRG